MHTIYIQPELRCTAAHPKICSHRYAFRQTITIPTSLPTLINHSCRPSSHPSTSPSTNYNQTPPSPTSHSPHYAPYTSTVQTPPDSSAPRCAPDHSAALSSSSGSPRRRPSRGTAGRRGAGTTRFWLGARGPGRGGTLLLGRAGGSRCGCLGSRRRGGSPHWEEVMGVLWWAWVWLEDVGMRVLRMLRVVLAWSRLRISSSTSKRRRMCMFYICALVSYAMGYGRRIDRVE